MRICLNMRLVRGGYNLSNTCLPWIFNLNSRSHHARRSSNDPLEFTRIASSGDLLRQPRRHTGRPTCSWPDECLSSRAQCQPQRRLWDQPCFRCRFGQSSCCNGGFLQCRSLRSDLGLKTLECLSHRLIQQFTMFIPSEITLFRKALILLWFYTWQRVCLNYSTST